MKLTLLIAFSCIAVATVQAATAPPTPPGGAPTAPPTPPGQLKCRICNNAKSLGDCNKEAPCDDNEACYMESVITDSLEIVYNGGCRAVDVCTQASGGFGKKKRDGLIACSTCCDSSQSCNTKLCGIEDKLLNASNCYFCNKDSDQNGVDIPTECSTLTVCQHDEVCYSGKQVVAGQPRYVYGCRPRRICEILMNEVYKEWDRCNSDPTALGCIQHRATSVCNACCGYGGCNSGTCEEQRARNYVYYQNNVWDKHAMTPFANATTRRY